LSTILSYGGDTMTERVDTIVIGAGQAGLSTSYHLSRLGREHVILERGRVAETWRTQRWDGFYLNTPNWAQQLPGQPYRGDEPDAFPPLAEVIAYLDDYARTIAADVREGVPVTALRRETDGRYAVETDSHGLQAENVVVATGAYQRPTPTALARQAPGDVLQLHTSEYRRPEQLPAGAVLVVGAGQSGCQIADELIDAGRAVYLSVGACPWIPRRYRGHDIVHWLVESGLADQTVDTLPGPEAKLTCNPPVSGNNGGHDCNARWLAARGAVLVARVTGFDGTVVRLEGDVAETLAKAADATRELLGKIDDYIETGGLDVAAAGAIDDGHLGHAVARELDLRSAGVSTVLWANGFRPDYGWIDLPVADAFGWPLQSRGVAEFPGLYFVGVHWLHKRRSSLFLGVGEDAEYVASHLAER
jgi:putative flavoprotein involved in K+ transport